MKTEHKGIHCCSGKLCRCEQHINQCSVICSLTASSPAFPADWGFHRHRRVKADRSHFSALQTPRKPTGAPGVTARLMDEQDAGADGIPCQNCH